MTAPTNNLFKKIFLTSITLLAISFVIPSTEARNNIQIVGSSTVFPFASQVAEYFSRTTNHLAPVVESTGSGGGFKLFCSGVGAKYPDIVNSSRAIKESEIKLCKKNGVEKIIEVLIGFDGIAIVNNINSESFSLTTKDIFRALAKTVPNENGDLIPNPNAKWSDINPSLPDYSIKVYGPPPTSGTRDAFLELAMEKGAKAYPSLQALKKTDKKKFKAVAHSLREDGAYISSGENDNLIINKITKDDKSFGILGYSFLEESNDKVQGVSIDGFLPEFENINSGDYTLTRPLYFYAKKEHLGYFPGIHEYLKEFVSEKSFGEDGYLTDQGLIPLPLEQRKLVREKVKNLEFLK